MAKIYIISGTDTGIGKTTVAALLVLGLGACYWKPVQSGVDDGSDGGTDRQRVQRMTELPDASFLPERYILTQPLSPHRAAELDGVEIDAAAFPVPACEQTLIIEGAGGLLVPMTRQCLQIDLFAAWGAPVILCARTALGTINHTLLSVEALRRRGMTLHGIIFIDDDNPDTVRTIAAFSGAPVLGRVPRLDVINRATLLGVFKDHFRSEDFT